MSEKIMNEFVLLLQELTANISIIVSYRLRYMCCLCDILGTKPNWRLSNLKLIIYNKIMVLVAVFKIIYEYPMQRFE